MSDREKKIEPCRNCRHGKKTISKIAGKGSLQIRWLFVFFSRGAPPGATRKKWRPLLQEAPTRPVPRAALHATRSQAGIPRTPSTLSAASQTPRYITTMNAVSQTPRYIYAIVNHQARIIGDLVGDGAEGGAEFRRGLPPELSGLAGLNLRILKPGLCL